MAIAWRTAGLLTWNETAPPGWIHIAFTAAVITGDCAWGDNLYLACLRIKSSDDERMRGKKRKSSEPRPLGLLQCRWPCQRKTVISLSLTPFFLCGVEPGHLSVSPTALLSLSYHHRDRKRPLARPRHWVWTESVLVSLCVYVHARVLESVCVENGICCMPQTWGKTTFWTRFSICVCLWHCLYVKGRKIRGWLYVCVFVCEWGTLCVVDCMLL